MGRSTGAVERDRGVALLRALGAHERRHPVRPGRPARRRAPARLDDRSASASASANPGSRCAGASRSASIRCSSAWPGCSAARSSACVPCSRTASTNGSRSSSGRRSRCEPRITVVKYSFGSGGSTGHGCSQVQTSVKPACVQALRSSPRASRSSTARPSRAARDGRRRRSPAWTLATLPAPPHWAASRPPGRSAACRRANRRSWSSIQWKVAVLRIASTGSSSVSSSEVGGERGRSPRAAGLLDHRLAAVDGDHRAVRDALGEHLGDAAGAAAGVEHPLVAPEVEPVDDVARHRELRVGHAVVRAGIPFTWRHTSVRYRIRRYVAARVRALSADLEGQRGGLRAGLGDGQLAVGVAVGAGAAGDRLR